MKTAPVLSIWFRLVLVTGLSVLAACGPKGPDDSRPVVVSLEMDRAAAVPGENITLVWRLAVAPDWHLYWPGRNDSGFAPRIDLTLPAGWIAGGLQWPAPVRHLSDGDILDHVYYEELVLLQTVGVPADAPVTGRQTVTAQVEWLACRESCVPGKASVELAVPLAARQTGERSPLAEAARGRLPRELPAGLLQTGWRGQSFEVAGPAGTQLVFMPSEDCGDLVNLIRDGVGGKLALRFKVTAETVGPVRGLITLTTPDGDSQAYRLEFPARALTDTSSGG